MKTNSQSYGECVLANLKGEYMYHIALYLEDYVVEKDQYFDHHALVLTKKPRWSKKPSSAYLPVYSVYDPNGSEHGDYIALNDVMRVKGQSLDGKRWVQMDNARAVYRYHSEHNTFFYSAGIVNGTVQFSKTIEILNELSDYYHYEPVENDGYVRGEWQITKPICPISSDLILIGDRLIYDDYFAEHITFYELEHERVYYLPSLDGKAVANVVINLVRAVNNHTLQLRVERTNEPDNLKNRPLWVDFEKYQLPLFNLDGVYRVDDPIVLTALMIVHKGLVGETNQSLNPKVIGYGP